MEYAEARDLTATQDLADVTAVILAGGLGTRLRSVVSKQPKVLADVRGRPFLAYLLDRLSGVGIKTVVLCTGYLGEQVERMFGDSYCNMDLVYSFETSPLGTAGAVRLAAPLLKSDFVLVMNGDSFCDANLEAFWAWHCERSAAVSLLLSSVADAKRYGLVGVNDEGCVLYFNEKDGQCRPGWISAGIYLMSRPFLLTIPEKMAVSLERETFPSWIGRGLYGYQSESQFLDIGTPESYAEAEQFLLSETLR